MPPGTKYTLPTRCTAETCACAILGYAYIYNLTAEAVAAGAAVVFDSNGPLLGISHAQPSSSITITKAGTYAISFSVSGTQPNQFALFVNGTVQTSTVYGSGTGTQQNTGFSILKVNAKDVITLVNYTSSAAVNLASQVGGTQKNVNASILIQRLA